MASIRWTLVLVSWFGFLTLPARAGGDLSTAERLTAEMKYSKALKTVNKLLKSPKSQPSDLAAAYRIRGMCLAAMGKDKQATAAYQRLLALEPGFEMSRKESPKLRLPFDRALKASKGIKPLKIEHVPPKVGPKLAGTVLTLSLQSNPYLMVKRVRLVYRVGKKGWKKKVWKVKKPRRLVMKLPTKLKSDQVSYFYEALNRTGGLLASSGDAKQPHTLQALSTAGPVVAAAGDTQTVKDEGLDLVAPTAKEAPGSDAHPAKTEPSGTDGSGSPSETGTAGSETDGDKMPPDLTAAAMEAQLEEPQKTDPVVPSEGSVKDEPEDESGKWYTTWWFWTTVGVVVAGAAAGTAVALTMDNSDGPMMVQVHLR